MKQFFFNGTILTLDKKQPLASAMLIDSENIVAVGRENEFNPDSSIVKINLKFSPDYKKMSENFLFRMLVSW